MDIFCPLILCCYWIEKIHSRWNRSFLNLSTLSQSWCYICQSVHNRLRWEYWTLKTESQWYATLHQNYAIKRPKIAKWVVALVVAMQEWITSVKHCILLQIFIVFWILWIFLKPGKYFSFQRLPIVHTFFLSNLVFAKFAKENLLNMENCKLFAITKQRSLLRRRTAISKSLSFQFKLTLIKAPPTGISEVCNESTIFLQFYNIFWLKGNNCHVL